MPAPGTANPGLTVREQQVARMLATGHSRQQIAEHFKFSRGAVDSYRKVIYLKARVRDRAQLFRWAQRQGLIDAIDRN